MGDKARDEPRSRSWGHAWEHGGAREVSFRRNVSVSVGPNVVAEKGRKVQDRD